VALRDLRAADIEEPVLYTTYQVAKMLGVSSRKVAAMIDGGDLPGFRLPGGLDRRVRRNELVRFIHSRGWPVPSCLGVSPVNLAFGLGAGEPDWPESAEVFDSPVRLGAAIRGADAVGLFVAGDGLGLSLALAACECCREWHPAARVALVAGPDAGAVACPAADAVFVRPVEWPAVLARLALPGRGK